MCMSAVWVVYPDGQKEKITENASYVRQEGPVVSVGTFMAPPRQFVGDLVEVDAQAHTITLRAEPPVALKIEGSLPAAASEPA
jgi:predicted RNA-binding protein